MIKQYKVSDFDVVYISYDEPNAEKNWADLKSKCPWAKRVHGCLLYTSPSPRDQRGSRMPSSA